MATTDILTIQVASKWCKNNTETTLHNLSFLCPGTSEAAQPQRGQRDGAEEDNTGDLGRLCFPLT